MTTKRLFGCFVALMTLVSLAASPALAQNSGSSAAAPQPCTGKVWWADSSATYSDFDFWVGEWQVYDSQSGDLMGFDVIEKELGGCVLRQNWRQLHDRFAPPDRQARLRGGSDTALNAKGQWQQIWIDNNGSYLPMSGGLDENGVMVLESDWLEFKTRQGQSARLKYRMHWSPQADGSIHNWGLILNGAAEEAGWQKYFDIVYRRNIIGGPSARLHAPEKE